jgi:hypothetical protein
MMMVVMMIRDYGRSLSRVITTNVRNQQDHQSPTLRPCSGASEYYSASGITINGVTAHPNRQPSRRPTLVRSKAVARPVAIYPPRGGHDVEPATL